jgi:hypothetical protein
MNSSCRTRQLRHSRPRLTQPGTMMFEFHKAVNCTAGRLLPEVPGSAAVFSSLQTFHYYEPSISAFHELIQNPSLLCVLIQVLFKSAARWRLEFHCIDSVFPVTMCWPRGATPGEE